ncbi:hypothetical protein CAG71_02705, partial [Photobacterium halotolerans]|nr:hypothetical protein [Photobacterium halotolerans]
MEFLEVLKSKEIDIYISLFMTISGLILGLVIDSFKQRNVQGGSPSNGPITSITVTNIVKPQINQANSSSNDDGLMFIIGFILLVTGVVY